MDASAALAELLELSTQIVEAVVVSADGEVVASRAASDERARELASAGADLLSAAATIRSAAPPGVERVHVDHERGSLVVARDAERSLVATTVAEPTVGLVAFDLRATLRRLREATA